MDAKRYLIVTADDFGIGPATSEGILELGAEGLVTATVLLVNSPYAEQAVLAWRRAGQPVELGWHPCLTLDRPVLPPDRVPSLVQPDGCFWPLGSFVQRLYRGRIQAAEIEAELAAQCARFRSLVGRPPTVVNTHHHVQIFPPISALLRRLLAGQQPLPYLRRVREPVATLAGVSGGRCKRLLLSVLGRREARQLGRAGFPGNDVLIGVTDPDCVADPDFLVHWLRRTPGRVVELTCHPGYLDSTLIGRDCPAADAQLHRRPRELLLLRHPSFRATCTRSGLARLTPGQLSQVPRGGHAHAA